MSLFPNEIHLARRQEKSHSSDSEELKELHITVEPPPDSAVKTNGDLHPDPGGASSKLRHRTTSLTEETVIT